MGVVLVGARREPEPSIIGQIQHPFRTLCAGKGIADFGGKYRFVTDQGHRRGKPGILRTAGPVLAKILLESGQTG